MRAGRTPTTAGDSERPGLSWGNLLRWVAVAMSVALLGLGLLIRVPPLIVIAALFAGAAWLYRRKERPGAIVLVVLFVLVLLLNAPFIIPSLAAPASTIDFLPTVIVTLLGIVGTISAIAVIRRGTTSEGGARMIAMGAATVLVVAAAVTTIAKIAYPDVSARPGDISLVTEDFEFSEESLTASGGRIAVFVDNKDATLHTFTVEELAVDLEIPAGEPGRITFAAEPGTYEFFCRPHEADMRGTLRISG